MPDRTVIMRRGQKIAFALSSRHREHVLYASREDGGIVFRTKGAPLGRIAGEGFAAKIEDERPSSRRDTYVLELLEDGDTIRLTTPEHDLRTCVHLDAVGGAIHLVGGSSLVERIEGAHLASILDEEAS